MIGREAGAVCRGAGVFCFMKQLCLSRCSWLAKSDTDALRFKKVIFDMIIILGVPSPVLETNQQLVCGRGDYKHLHSSQVTALSGSKCHIFGFAKFTDSC